MCHLVLPGARAALSFQEESLHCLAIGEKYLQWVRAGQLPLCSQMLLLPFSYCPSHVNASHAGDVPRTWRTGSAWEASLGLSPLTSTSAHSRSRTGDPTSPGLPVSPNGHKNHPVLVDHIPAPGRRNSTVAVDCTCRIP